ncbi:hypothetical protein EV122DRAFT_191885, partial [Schizophyllum commune]
AADRHSGSENKETIQYAQRILAQTKHTCGFCFVVSLLGYLPAQSATVHTIRRCPMADKYDRGCGGYYRFVTSIRHNPAQRPLVCPKCHFPSLGKGVLHAEYEGLEHPHRTLVGPMLWAVYYVDADLCQAAKTYLNVEGSGHNWDSAEAMGVWMADRDATVFPCSAVALLVFISRYF